MFDKLKLTVGAVGLSVLWTCHRFSVTVKVTHREMDDKQMNQEQFNKLSYRDLEEKSDGKFSHVTWYRWLTKPKRSPNLHDIEEMAPLFGVSAEKLSRFIHRRRMENISPDVNAA